MDNSALETPAPATANELHRTVRRPLASGRIASFALLGVLVVEIAVFSILSPDEFATASNFRTTLVTQAVLGVLTIAMLLPLIAGDFDVSLAMVFTIAMVVAANLETAHGWPIWLAALAALTVATAIGAVSGVITVVSGADSLVVTLGMLTLLRGFAEAITQGDTFTIVGSSGDVLRRVATPILVGVPVPVFYLAAIAAVVWYVTEHTTIGRSLYAVGGSREGARLAGLRVSRLRIGAFAAGGLLAGVAGMLQLAKTTTAGANLGAGFLFPALAAAFLGAASFRLGAFNVRGSLTAIAVLAVGVTGIRMSGAPLWIDEVFNGTALMVAVAAVRWIRTRTD